MTLVSERILRDRYQLVDVLGEGGMSVVYMARDRNLHERTWAVKEVFPDPCNDEDARMALEAFESEARVLGALDHPGVPHIVDAFFESGRGYLVMERVPGRDLQTLLDEKGRWSEDEALRLGLEICAILRYLHERPVPVIFRDLKPSNVMIDDAADRVVLIDFGIARHFRSQRRKDTVAIGTLGYAPPEQYSAEHPPDARADVYALGALLYFTLTGRDPQQHAPFDFPPLREFIPEVGRETAAAIDRALSYDAERRPATAAEMEGLLRKALAAWKERRDPKPRRRAGRWLLLGALLLAVIAALLASRRPPPPPPAFAMPVAIGPVGTFHVPLDWRTFDAPNDLPPPMGRPLLLFGKSLAWVVMAHPGGAAGVGSYGDTVELDPTMQRVLAAPSVQYWGAPGCVLDDADRLLVSDVRGVSRIAGTEHRLLWVPEGRSTDDVMDARAAPAARLFRGGDGHPYAVYAGGFARMGEDGPEEHRHVEGRRVVAARYSASPPDAWLPHDPRPFWIDAQGAVWLDDGGLERIAADGSATRFSAVPVPRDGSEVLFAADGQGRTWVGVGDALFRIEGDAAMRVPLAGGATLHQLLDTRGPFVLALTTRGLYRVEGDDLSLAERGGPRSPARAWQSQLPRAIPQSTPWQADGGRWTGALDAQGRYWFWGPQGLFRLADGVWSRGKLRKKGGRHVSR